VPAKATAMQMVYVTVSNSSAFAYYAPDVADFLLRRNTEIGKLDGAFMHRIESQYKSP
jgi:hypothetical protein